jgi:hypothetical protein
MRTATLWRFLIWLVVANLVLNYSLKLNKNPSAIGYFVS